MSQTPRYGGFAHRYVCVPTSVDFDLRHAHSRNLRGISLARRGLFDHVAASGGDVELLDQDVLGDNQERKRSRRPSGTIRSTTPGSSSDANDVSQHRW